MTYDKYIKYCRSKEFKICDSLEDSFHNEYSEITANYLIKNLYRLLDKEDINECIYSTDSRLKYTVKLLKKHSFRYFLETFSPIYWITGKRYIDKYEFDSFNNYYTILDLFYHYFTLSKTIEIKEEPTEEYKKQIVHNLFKRISRKYRRFLKHYKGWRC